MEFVSYSYVGVHLDFTLTTLIIMFGGKSAFSLPFFVSDIYFSQVYLKESNVMPECSYCKK